MLWWKKAKHLINDAFFARIEDYNIHGPKDQEFLVYQQQEWL